MMDRRCGRFAAAVLVARLADERASGTGTVPKEIESS
jgi:hypothetical protein